MGEAKARPVTAADIRGAMLKRWADPEWAIMWEVAPATGAAIGKVRYADAVMMSLWPSRGLELHGVEIKVSRSDWRREAADPTKAERIAAYCERWWVHTPPGVVQDLSEMPPMWGLREFDGKAWKTIREAEKTEAAACDRGFLAALLRRADGLQREQARQLADEANRSRWAAVEAAREAINSRVKAEVERRTASYTQLAARIEAFEATCGLKIDADIWGEERAKLVGRIVNAILSSGVAEFYGGLRSAATQTRKTAEGLDATLLTLGLDKGLE